MTVSVNISVVEGAKEYRGFVHALPRALDAVLFDFNVTGNPDVTEVKTLHAALIQKMHDLQGRVDCTPAQGRAASIAINELEGTQMRAVKAYFAK